MTLSSRRLQLAPVEGTQNGLVVVGPNGNPAELTNWSFGQIAQLAKAPAGYLRSLPSALAADNVNYGLQVARDVEDIGVLLYKNGGPAEMRAVTGPAYGRVWNSTIANALVDRFGDGLTGDFKVPGEFGKDVVVTKDNTTLYASDRDMFVFLADEKHRIELPNRRDGKAGALARGFFVWNSEVGASTFGIATFLFDYVCCNRIVWGAQEYREIKLRHTASAPDRWIEEVVPAIQDYANSGTTNIVEALQKAQAAKIGSPEKVDEFLRSRFTKSHATAPATDDAKRWSGWGTALKPAIERWILARKPLDGTVAANVLAHGVGALNIDGCRVDSGSSPSVDRRAAAARSGKGRSTGASVFARRTTLERFTEQRAGEALGRWPSNLVLSHAETCGDECDAACPVRGLDEQSGVLRSGDSSIVRRSGGQGHAYGRSYKQDRKGRGPDEGGASRFFPVFHPFGYFGKAKSKSQRGGQENKHPTVKNIELMRWLVRLITPPGGLVVDAFAGSGTTGVAALLEGCRFAAAEADADSYETARARLAAAELGETVIRGTSTRTAEPHPQPARRDPQTETTEQVVELQLRLPGTQEGGDK
jgi:hypothetical protein